MAKSERELAFLRDLEINESWTSRFTGLLDKHLGLKDSKKIAYLNAGTGDHCIAIREKLDDKTEVFASCENDELLNIARDKGAAVRSDVDFSTVNFEDDTFDAVIADASFTLPATVEELVRQAARIARPGGRVAVILPSAGSFGEVFSLLWEVLFNADLGEHGEAIERLIAEIPSTSRIEEMAGLAGLEKVKTESAKEVFEYLNGAEFVSSPLVADFLLPRWLETLNEEQGEEIREKLVQLIDDEDGSLTFRFTIKATLLTGEKRD